MQQLFAEADMLAGPMSQLTSTCGIMVFGMCVCRQQTAEQQLQHALESGEAVDVVSLGCSTPEHKHHHQALLATLVVDELYRALQPQYMVCCGVQASLCLQQLLHRV